MIGIFAEASLHAEVILNFTTLVYKMERNM
jgi:hypothetical protein